MKLFFKIYLSLAVLLIGFAAHAQSYQTQSGSITISGKYKGTAFSGVSKQLHVKFDYERAEMYMHLNIPAIVTNNDSLNDNLSTLVNENLIFKGKLNSNHVNTTAHAKLKGNVAGTITLNNLSKPFTFKTILVHMPVGSVNCILTGDFIIDLLDFKIPVSPGENKVKMTFQQLILKRSNNS